MTDILEYIRTWSVLKWIVLVLIAGFIGQFGRMMAEAITRKISLRRANNQRSDADVKSGNLPSVPPAAARIPDKKLIKALAKARKKEAKKNK
ncbi:MAG: hypothetical protein A2031_07755 [Deltaproteobacteria bacterium RBG_19FT_COMBO_43_11]|nr:MAG: hypothetical protein A2031_07755 [Deltaproteobacteria bacterium RBG_19FT_COMBO_43_11]